MRTRLFKLQCCKTLTGCLLAEELTNWGQWNPATEKLLQKENNSANSVYTTNMTSVFILYTNVNLDTNELKGAAFKVIVFRCVFCDLCLVHVPHKGYTAGLQPPPPSPSDSPYNTLIPTDTQKQENILIRNH